MRGGLGARLGKMEAYTFLWLALCLVEFGGVSGYPSGKVSVACGSMMPSHAASRPQTSPSPYTITVSKTTFNPSERITVSLQGNGNTFAGFLVQAKSVGGDFTVGSFVVTDPNSQGLECNKAANAAVSHTSRTAKSSLTVTWIAPPASGYVRFRATFVQSYAVFWTGVESQILQPLHISSKSCKKEKLCFSHPMECDPATSTSCFFMSSVPIPGGGFVFEMSAPAGGYVAIGFSNDKNMGNDDIYICMLMRNGQVAVQTAFSTGKTSPTIRNPTSVESPVTSSHSGTLKCTFISRSNITLTSRRASSHFYIFLAVGPVANGVIRKHSQTPFITNEMVDLLDIRADVSESPLPIKVKIHGFLMLIAWMTTGAIGMLFARYMKKAANGSVFGKDLWFQVHQLLMVLTVLATITAFILIFTEAMGWSYEAGTHPILGCIVMILALLQPIVALFRPSPKESNRYLFNWFHALNALVIKVLAVATLFLGFHLIDTSTNLWMAKVLGGFVAWEILIMLLLEVNILSQSNDPDIYESTTKIRKEVVIIIIYVFGNLAFLIALLWGIFRL